MARLRVGLALVVLGLCSAQVAEAAGARHASWWARLLPFSASLQAAPVNSLPASATTPQGTPLVFSVSGGNAVTISDASVGAQAIKATLFTNAGTLTLASTTGLTFDQGHGNGTANPAFTGTVADLNAALDGLTFTPLPRFAGLATLSLTTDDLGLGGGSQAVVTNSLALPVTATGWGVAAWGDSTYRQTSVPAGLSGVVGVAAGYLHTVALKADGTVVAWGTNNYHQTDVPAGLSTVRSLAAGNFHTLALKADGTVVAWGDNSKGQTNVPAGLGGVVSIAAGEYHNLAVRADGSVVAWGLDDAHQTDLPAGLSGVVAAAGGYAHSLVLKYDGTVVAWGDNTQGQTTVPALTNVVAVAAGLYHSLALKSDGTVRGWGDDTRAQASALAGQSQVTAIAAGQYHSLALLADGTVKAGGSNQFDQSNVPSGLGVANAIAAGVIHSAAVSAAPPSDLALSNAAFDDTEPAGLIVGQFTTTSAVPNQAFHYTLVSGTGSDDNGSFTLAGDTLVTTVQFDASTKTDYTIRVQTTDLLGQSLAKAFAITVTHVNRAPSLSLPGAQTTLQSQPLVFGSAGGNALTVADPDSGSGALQLTLFATGGTLTLAAPSGLTFADGHANGTPNPIASGTLAALNASLAGLTYTPNRTTAGLQVLRVAVDDQGHTGDGGAQSALGTVKLWVAAAGGAVVQWGALPGGATGPTSGAVGVAAGAYHSLALKADGSLVGWGDNSYGQTSTPGVSAQAVAAGQYFGLALAADGSVAAWGRNDRGQTSVPAGLTGVVGVAAGAAHALAVKADGTVVGWGANDGGQATVPAGLGGVVAVAAGLSSSLALRQDGTVVAWGTGASVPGNLSSVVALAAGNGHYLAVKADGSVTAWGDNTYGQTNVAAGSYVAAAGGQFHSVGLKADGTLAAWGWNQYNQSSAPGATGGIAVAGGWYHSLAVALASPSALSLNPTSVPELQPVGTVVGALSTTDANLGQSFTYSLVSGDGSADNGSFAIDGANLVTTAVFDQSVKASYAVRVRSTDSLGLSVEQALTITVLHLNRTPSLSVPGTQTCATGGSVTFNSTNKNAIVAADSDAGTNPLKLTITATNGTAAVGYVGGLTFTSGHGTGTANPTGIGTLTGINQALRNLRYTPRARFVGLAVLQITVDDQGSTGWGGPRSVTQTIRIMVGGTGLTAVAWGANAAGQSTVPLGVNQPLGLAAGNLHSALVQGDQSVLGWGDNSSGQGGSGASGVLALAAGARSTYALKADGSVASWGAGATPPALSNVVALAAGGEHALAVVGDGSVSAWGSNLKGESTVPAGLGPVAAVAAGYQHSLALKTDGTVAAWGDNSLGQCNVPAGLTRIVAVAAGDFHSLALSYNGTVYAWGDNSSGQTSIPAGTSGVVAIAASVWHNLALKSNGTVVGWGTNWFGESSVPAGVANVATIAAGGNHSLALQPATAPSALALSQATVVESQPTGTVVGTLSVTDPDPGESHAYTLVTGTGGDDNSSFAINGNQLTTNEVFDYEVKANYTVRVRCTDSAGLWTEQAFAITVTNGLEPPSLQTLTATNAGPQSLTFTGANLQPGLTLVFRRAGQADRLPTNIVVKGGTQVTCDCNLFDAVPGNWDVVATNPDTSTATLSGALVIGEALTGVNLAVAPSQQSVVGTNLTLTATPAGTPTATEYRFTWSAYNVVTAQTDTGVVRDWDPSPTATTSFSWSRPYTFTVTARQVATVRSYTVVGNASYLVQPTDLLAVTLSASPAGGAPVNSTVTLTAKAMGGASLVEYAFSWSSLNTSTGLTETGTIRGWGGPTTTWTPTSARAYRVTVNTRKVGANALYQATASLNYGVWPTGLTGVTLSAAPPSPQLVNTAVGLTATVGGSAPNLEYQFVWSAATTASASNDTGVIRDWNASPVATWTPSVARVYTVTVNVRQQGAPTLYQATAALSYQVLPQGLSAVALSATPPSPQLVGTPVGLSATITGGAPDVQYQFVWTASNTLTGGTDSGLIADWSSTPGTTWTPAVARLYRVTVNARRLGSVAPYQVTASLNYLVQPLDLLGVVLGANPPSPQLVNTPITLTALPVGGAVDVEYQFAWSAANTATGVNDTGLLRDWGTNTALWTPSVARPYTLTVYARKVGSVSPYQATTTLSYLVQTPALTGVGLAVSPPSPATTGTTLTLTATPTPAGGNVEYQFLWSANNVVTGKVDSGVIRGWGGSSTTWSTADARPYTFTVYARLVGSNATYQATAKVSYTVQPANLTGVTLAAAPPSPQLVGTAVTLTATALGGATSVEYQFTWSALNQLTGVTESGVLRDYEAGNTFVWTPSIARTYRLVANVRLLGSLAAAQQTTAIAYLVQPTDLTGVKLTASPKSPAAVNTPITLTATPVGSAPNVEYQFLVSYYDSVTRTWGAYAPLRGWGVNTTLWTPSVAGAYTLQVNARKVGSWDAYQAFARLSFTVGPS